MPTGISSRPTPAVPLSLDLPCLARGATTGYHPQAYEQAIADVKAFLSEIFGPTAP